MKDYKVVGKKGIIFESKEAWESKIRELRKELNEILDHYDIAIMSGKGWYCYGSPPQDVSLELQFQWLVEKELHNYAIPVLEFRETPRNTYIEKQIVE